METKILNGIEYQKREFDTIKTEIEAIKENYKLIPGIVFIAFIGHLSLMKYTIALHMQAANSLGFNTKIITLQHLATEEEMIAIIEKLNHDDDVHAIVLLQPVPKHINALNLIKKIKKDKEVEGFHPENVIETLTKGIYNSQYPMCLPMALKELFKYSKVETKPGEEYVFIADQDFISDKFRSLILLTASSQVIPAGCSYTIVNSDNSKIKEFCKRADFLFVLSENPEFFRPDWLKQGACIVDIYSNLINEVQSKKNPDLLLPVIRGGVNTESVFNIASFIAPCPGGLMPVLMAVLLRNALIAFKILAFSNNTKLETT